MGNLFSMTTLFFVILGTVAAIVGYVLYARRLNPANPIFDTIRHGFQVVILIGIVVLLILLFLKPSSTVTLPGGEKIKIPDYSQYLKDIQQKLKGLDTLNKKVNDLESEIRKKNTEVITEKIPEALKEKDVKKSVERMKDQW